MKYSKYTYGNEIDYSIERLTEQNYYYVENFKCGNSEINNYLVNKALSDEFGITYLIVDKKDSVAIGYCTMCCSGITHKYQNNIRTLPAIEIRYFAITHRLHKLLYDCSDDHYYFSDHIMANFMYKCSEISETILAAKYIILYSVKKAVNFYERLGFYDFTEYFEADTYRYLDGCKPMYIEIP
jgi:hypothetical protein